MTESPLKLYISGGKHVTRPERRIKAIEDALGDVDVIFIESPVDSPSRRKMVLNFLATPVMIMCVYLYIIVLTAWGRLTKKDDQEIVNHFEETYDAEVIPTDRGFHQLISEDRGLWFLGHTVFVFLAVLAIPRFINSQFLFLPVEARLFSLFCLTGLGLFVLFLAGTLPARNTQMARDIEQKAASQSDLKACLVTGTAHVSGVEKELSQTDLVELCGSEQA